MLLKKHNEKHCLKKTILIIFKEILSRGILVDRKPKDMLLYAIHLNQSEQSLHLMYENYGILACSTCRTLSIHVRHTEDHNGRTG